MELITSFTQSSLKKNIPDLQPGDTVRVHQKIREGNKERVQIFEGTVMAVRGGKSINSSFVVRRIASGVGVEKTFPLHSPNVVKVERVKSSKVRQARLYYLRERHGRTARMSGETRDNASWDDVAVADEGATEDSRDKATEATSQVSDKTSEDTTLDTTQAEQTEEDHETPPADTEETAEVAAEDNPDETKA